MYAAVDQDFNPNPNLFGIFTKYDSNHLAFITSETLLLLEIQSYSTFADSLMGLPLPYLPYSAWDKSSLIVFAALVL